jgi:ABC-2 type transport system ATP-binding protein
LPDALTTLMKADAGTVRVAGHDVATEAKAVRAVIGITGQFAAVDELLTGRENLQLMVDLNRLVPERAAGPSQSSSVTRSRW